MMTLSGNADALGQAPAGLAGLRWEHRVILVFAREPAASNALSNLHEFSAEIEDRDIAWFLLGDESLRTNYDGELDEKLREQLTDHYFTPAPAGTEVILIGKDGTLKKRSPDLDLEDLFGLIDQMPMRREEMRLKTDSLD
jgi:hypothetical protein